MRGRCYMLARVGVHLGLDKWLVLMVRIVMRVFLQMYKGFLRTRYVQMICVDSYRCCLVGLAFAGVGLAFTGVGLAFIGVGFYRG